MDQRDGRFAEASRLLHDLVQLFGTPTSESSDPTSSNSSASATTSITATSASAVTAAVISHPLVSGEAQRTLTFSSGIARSASQEFRNAFAPYSRNAYQFSRFGRGVSASSYYRGAGRRRAPFTSVNNTWTHKFCVIPFKDHEHVPSLQEKDAWHEAGMGEKTIVFPDKNGAQSHIEETLCSAFPKLRDAGGFLLMRSSTSRQDSRRGAGGSLLSMITMPFGGYTIPYLRHESPLHSATCFVRPLQRDLPFDSMQSESVSSQQMVSGAYSFAEVFYVEFFDSSIL